MRVARLAGIVLIAAGTAALVWSGTFASRREMLEVGGVAGSLVLGVALMVIDARRKLGARG